MPSKQLSRTVKYESELEHGFAEEIAKIPGCENIATCIQCGTCSATCPMSIYMDYTPRQIVAMARAGFRDEVLNSFTIWLCASCYSCTVRCPVGIKVTDTLYALKRIAMEQHMYPARFPVHALSKSFVKNPPVALNSLTSHVPHPHLGHR